MEAEGIFEFFCLRAEVLVLELLVMMPSYTGSKPDTLRKSLMKQDLVFLSNWAVDTVASSPQTKTS